MKKRLFRLYELMRGHYGHTGWWPGDSPFEIAVGAILTQNTAWTNVEKALANLKRERLLAPRRILDCPRPKLEEALRPSGYFRVKTERLRAFCRYLVTEHGGKMAGLAAMPLDDLRASLLAIHGIGPETADDIILYACDKPVFVIDAYTRRILSRHGLKPAEEGYEDLREFFETHLGPDTGLFKEYHGLIVYTGKDFCKRRPNCEGCPLEPALKRGQPL